MTFYIDSRVEQWEVDLGVSIRGDVFWSLTHRCRETNGWQSYSNIKGHTRACTVLLFKRAQVLSRLRCFVPDIHQERSELSSVSQRFDCFSIYMSVCLSVCLSVFILYCSVVLSASKQSAWHRGLCSLKRHGLTGIGIIIIHLRRSDGQLSYIVGIPLPKTMCVLSEQRPRLLRFMGSNPVRTRGRQLSSPWCNHHCVRTQSKIYFICPIHLHI